MLESTKRLFAQRTPRQQAAATARNSSSWFRTFKINCLLLWLGSLMAIESHFRDGGKQKLQTTAKAACSSCNGKGCGSASFLLAQKQLSYAVTAELHSSNCKKYCSNNNGPAIYIVLRHGAADFDEL